MPNRESQRTGKWRSVIGELRRRYLDALLSGAEDEAFRSARRRAGAPVLLLGIQGEQHTLGLQMAASILMHAGYRVIMLGGDLPLDELPAAIDRHRPAVVGLTATMPSTVEQLTEAIEGVLHHAPGAGVIVGGSGSSRVVSCFRRCGRVPSRRRRGRA
jgi:cobalamin-dependent methionine synthase I